MKNDKGYSLIELIVIIAIMGVVVGLLVPGTDVIFGFSAKEAKKKIEAATNNCKIMTLSKSMGKAEDTGSSELDYYVDIYREASGKYYIRKFYDGQETVEQLAPKRMTISYKMKNGDEGDISESGLKIAYNRATGAFLPNASDNYIKFIYCKIGSKTYTLEFMPNTGKIKEVY